MAARSFTVFAAIFAVSHGFGLKEIADYLLGGSFGQYPNYPGNNYPGNNYPGNNYPGNNYPSGPGLYPGGGQYPGNYPGSNYPQQNPGLAGPPGAHPGCPLCDSSVYSYCSYKQAHDACCCDNPAYAPYNCRKANCKSIYANTCEEYQLISNCCCVDVQKSAPVRDDLLRGAIPLPDAGPVVPVAPVGPFAAVVPVIG